MCNHPRCTVCVRTGLIISVQGGFPLPLLQTSHRTSRSCSPFPPPYFWPPPGISSLGCSNIAWEGLIDGFDLPPFTAGNSQEYLSDIRQSEASNCGVGVIVTQNYLP